MKTTINKFEFYTIEEPFVDYFNRCKDVDMTDYEIRKNFNYLKKYYDDMVISKITINDDIEDILSLDALYNNWKEFNL